MKANSDVKAKKKKELTCLFSSFPASFFFFVLRMSFCFYTFGFRRLPGDAAEFLFFLCKSIRDTSLSVLEYMLE